LKELGYEVQYDFVPMPGNQNEYYIFIVKSDGSLKPVFSNNKQHQKEGALYDYGVSEHNSKNIVDLVKNEL
jgi:hypothetical protein